MAKPASSGYGGASLLDLSQYPTAQEFVARCHEFFREVKDLYVLSDAILYYLVVYAFTVSLHIYASLKA